MVLNVSSGLQIFVFALGETMFPCKSLFEICRLLSYLPTKLKFCHTFCHMKALISHPGVGLD